VRSRRIDLESTGDLMNSVCMYIAVTPNRNSPPGRHLGEGTLALSDLISPSEGFREQRRPEPIAEEAALEGIDGVRTGVSGERLTAKQTVRTHKRPATAEPAFRSGESVDCELRPTGHRLPDRVRAHAWICLPAYYVGWPERRALAPALFDDEQRDSSRGWPVASAQRPPGGASPNRERSPPSIRMTRLAEAQRRALERLQVSL
jgi:hypothetical protein